MNSSESPSIQIPPPLELGIISDTHGQLRPQLFHLLDGVDHILHAGDLGPLDLLVELETLAPVTIVPGNTDGFDLRDKVPLVQRLRLGGLETVVTHGHQFGSPDPAQLSQAFPQADLIVFGHTHQPLLEERNGTWFVNPGSCGPRRFQLPVSLVRARITTEGFSGRVLHLDEG
jgi:uncharacterized protein